MAPSGFHMSAKNLCSICIDQRRNGMFSGRLFHLYRKTPIAFSTIGTAFEAIDELCSALNYPMNSDAPRSFETDPVPDYKKIRKLEKKMSAEELVQERGGEATFVVHVMYRQNATWQGNVTWTETGRTANFRSALELLRLMDSAVESLDSEKKQKYSLTEP